MADIATPSTARKTEEFSDSQVQQVKKSLGISSYPFQPDKTYIIFDADAGDNDLHIDTGGSSTYSILKGNGGLSGGTEESYTDTGGTKTLNYASAGRYVITISGTFNGIDLSGATSGDRVKYIGIIGGSNYPTSIVNSAFKGCSNLEYIKFDSVTTIGDNSFENCSLLKDISFNSVTTIGDYCFKDCASLSYVSFTLVTTISTSSFLTCTSLISVNFPLATTIESAAFYDCGLLTNINIPLVTTIGSSAFTNCSNLNKIKLLSVTSIGANSFENCSSLVYLTILYSAGLTIDSGAGSESFNSVSLSDLYVYGATNGTEAAAVETKVTNANAVQLTGYRLLY